MCVLGATDEQLADFFEVDRCSIHRWKIAHKPFADAIKDGKGVADDRVERALYSKALGYEYDETATTERDGLITEVKTTNKHLPADNTAMIFWLKNRRPDAWRERREPAQVEQDLESVLRELADKLPG